MSEWNVIHENFHTKHSVFTAPDEHMPHIIQLHIMSIRWAYYEQMKQQNIWSVHMTSIWKERESLGGVSGGEGRERAWEEREGEGKWTPQTQHGRSGATWIWRRGRRAAGAVSERGPSIRPLKRQRPFGPRVPVDTLGTHTPHPAPGTATDRPATDLQLHIHRGRQFRQ